MEPVLVKARRVAPVEVVVSWVLREVVDFDLP